MGIFIQKFGGTSVGNGERLINVAGIVGGALILGFERMAVRRLRAVAAE